MVILIKVIVIGPSGAGKSRLLESLSSGKFRSTGNIHSCSGGSNVKTINRLLRGHEISLKLLEMSDYKIQSSSMEAFSEVDGCLIVFDKTDVNSIKSACSWIVDWKRVCSTKNQESNKSISCIVVGNKEYSIGSKLKRDYELNIRSMRAFTQNLALSNELAYMEVSALTNEGTEELLQKIFQQTLPTALCRTSSGVFARMFNLPSSPDFEAFSDHNVEVFFITSLRYSCLFSRLTNEVKKLSRSSSSNRARYDDDDYDVDECTVVHSGECVHNTIHSTTISSCSSSVMLETESRPHKHKTPPVLRLQPRTSPHPHYSRHPQDQDSQGAGDAGADAGAGVDAEGAYVFSMDDWLSSEEASPVSGSNTSTSHPSSSESVEGEGEGEGNDDDDPVSSQESAFLRKWMAHNSPRNSREIRSPLSPASSKRLSLKLAPFSPTVTVNRKKAEVLQSSPNLSGVDSLKVKTMNLLNKVKLANYFHSDVK